MVVSFSKLKLTDWSRTEYNTAATVIASFGISLGTTVMNPVSIFVTDNFGWRNRFRVAGEYISALLDASTDRINSR